MVEKFDNLSVELNKARQTAQILYGEVQSTNAGIKDATLKEIGAKIASIPPQKYLRQYGTLRGHRDKISGIKWCQDSTKLLSACQDGFMIIWDTVTGLKLQAIPLQNSWVLSCSYSYSGNFVASAGLDNRCTVYRVNNFQNERGASYADSVELSERRGGRKTPRAHTAYVSACEFLNDNEVLTGSGDMTIALWDFAKDIKVRDFLDHMGDVLSLSVPRSGSLTPQTFFSSGADGYVKVWDTRTQGPQYSYCISKSDVECVTPLSQGYSFVAGCDSGICKLFDLRADCQLEEYSLKEHFDRPRKSFESPSSAESLWSRFDSPGVVSLDVSHSGRIMYACYADYGCIAWDLIKCEIIESIGIGGGSHTGRISQVAVSPDGQGLATASWDSTIKVWST
ncbi:putative G protein subunit beta [Clavispora lusitaniae]|uniref:G protein subunit beta n=1 Tax=Clavispora lusitaniae TaxID=36911 RepID=A0AA91PZ60_CLALS|nr:putative G protein subunit beta [Clavispora lusitaniae]